MGLEWVGWGLGELGVDELGDGDEVGGVGDVEEAVVEVLVGAFGGVEFAVVYPDVCALLGKGGMGLGRVSGTDGGVGLAYVDGQGIAIGGDNGRGLDVADDDVLLLLDLQADAGEAWGEGAVISGGCLALGTGGGSAQGK